MDHRNTIPELRAEIKELSLRVRLDKDDTYACHTLPGLRFYLADKLFFQRSGQLNAQGKTTWAERSKDKRLMTLSARLDKALNHV